MLRTWTALSLLILLMSCETFDPTVRVPSYIYVEPFEIRNDLSEWEGDSIYSHKITDVWVYQGESQFQGAYELPAIIPIDQTGYSQLNLYAGIKNSGISIQRKLYPFYQVFDIKLQLTENVVDTIRPYTYYEGGQGNPEIQMPWFDDFDDDIGGVTFTHADYSDTIVNKIKDSTLAYRGDQCGLIVMNDDQFVFEMISPTVDFPSPNVPVYLELNYKTNHEFIVGLYFNNKEDQISIYTVKEKDEWNKIYFDFTQYIQTNTSARDFNVFIGFLRDPSRSSVEMYIDNIKLIHY